MDYLDTLPREVRLMIFRPLLILSQAITIFSSRAPRRGYNGEDLRSRCKGLRGLPENFLALTLVNKNIRADTTALVYSLNAFEFGNSNEYYCQHEANLQGFRDFYKHTPAENLGVIQRAKFSFKCTPEIHELQWRPKRVEVNEARAMARNMCKSFYRLQSLCIELPMSEARPKSNRVGVTRPSWTPDNYALFRGNGRTPILQS